MDSPGNRAEFTAAANGSFVYLSRNRLLALISSVKPCNFLGNIHIDDVLIIVVTGHHIDTVGHRVLQELHELPSSHPRDFEPISDEVIVREDSSW